MQPLHDWAPGPLAKRWIGVFTDIDDTLTTEGAITHDALQALDRLQAAGLKVVAITGRPVGWSEPFARAWPLDAIVAENGAVALLRDDRSPGGLRKLYQDPPELRAERFARLQAVLARIEREVPGARRAQDSAGRETDIAIDHSEFTNLPPQVIDAVVALMQASGLRATVSSIHINGWIGAHDKLAGARWIVQQLWGRDLDREVSQWVYVGDSTNDQVMFAHFEHSVGVANVQRFAAQLHHPPRYVTPSERGAGFAELVQHLLQHR